MVVIGPRSRRPRDHCRLAALGRSRGIPGRGDADRQQLRVRSRLV